MLLVSTDSTSRCFKGILRAQLYTFSKIEMKTILALNNPNRNPDIVSFQGHQNPNPNPNPDTVSFQGYQNPNPDPDIKTRTLTLTSKP